MAEGQLVPEAVVLLLLLLAVCGGFAEAAEGDSSSSDAAAGPLGSLGTAVVVYFIVVACLLGLCVGTAVAMCTLLKLKARQRMQADDGLGDVRKDERIKELEEKVGKLRAMVDSMDSSKKKGGDSKRGGLTPRRGSQAALSPRRGSDSKRGGLSPRRGSQAAISRTNSKSLSKEGSAS